MKTTFVLLGECKGYSHLIQIIWGHWIVSESSNKTESIFTQKIFVDAIERIRRECKTTTTKQEEEGEEEKSTESTSKEESKSEEESTSEETSTEETTETTKSKTTKSTKKTTKEKRSSSTTPSTESYSESTTEDTATEEMTGECLFADKRYVQLLHSLSDYDTTTSESLYQPQHVFTKLNLVQQNLNEILGILSKYLTEPKCKKHIPPLPSTPYSCQSTSNRQIKHLKTSVKPLPTCIVKSRSSGKFPIDLKTVSTPKQLTKSFTNHNKDQSASLQNILKRLYNLDVRLSKLINITEAETTTGIPTSDKKYSEKRINQLKEFLRKYNTN